jgi:hypothetical protein
MNPEERAREKIDELLEAAGWVVQDRLEMIRDHIATSLRVEMSDLELSPFHDKGGPVKAYQTFGTDLNKLLEELNEALAA